jgi:uncharacterized protein YggT (Ycf19 family)
MLTVLNLAQLVLYIALLALAGQGILYLLAGARRQSNVFYRLLQLLSKPFTVPLRKIAPQLSNARLPIVTFLVLMALYAGVTFERAALCISTHRVGQAGCR